MPITKIWCWITIWLSTFLSSIWRRDEFFCPDKIVSIRFAAFMAKVIADTCISIRYGRRNLDEGS